MVLRAIRLVLNDYSEQMSGTSTVIVLRLVLDLMEGPEKEFATTKMEIARKYMFSNASVKTALENAKEYGILNVEDNGRVGVIVSFNDEFLK